MERSVGRVVIVAALLLLLPLHFTVSAPSPAPVQLTFNSKGDYNPVISADGQRIAFTSDLTGDLEIYIMNSDGIGLIPLTTNNVNDTAPSISGNGGKVVFESSQGADSDIWIVNGSGSSSATRLLQNTAEDLQPSISADATMIAFSSTYNPGNPGTNPEGDFEIFVIKPDGTGLRQLTFNTVSDTSPSINGDGTKVAFQSKLGGDYEIWTVNTDGIGLLQLTSNFEDDTSPSISSSGTVVSYQYAGPAIESVGPTPDSTIRTRGAAEVFPFEVYVVNSDGSPPVPRQVSATGGNNVTPAIGGDGLRIAYASTGDGDREIYRVNADGSGLIRITDNAFFDAEPSIDSTGQKIVFMSNSDGDFEIYSATPPLNPPDVAVTQMTLVRTVGYRLIVSTPLEVQATVQNQGAATVTVAAEFLTQGGPVLATQSVSLAAGASQVLLFGFNPQAFALGNYTLVVRVPVLPGESDTADNTRTGGPAEVRTPGDVDGDGDVDIIDAATLGFYYSEACGSPRFFLAADFDNDCDTDIIDAAIIGFYYGTVNP